MNYIITTVLGVICLISLIDALECGERIVYPSLIHGGQQVARGAYPWHAGLYDASSRRYLCGGTLIRTNIIISVANCVYNEQSRTVESARQIKVVLGKLYRDYDGDPPKSGVQFVDIESITVPKRYRGSQAYFYNDIAVLKLASHVTITSVVNVACVELNVASDDSVFSTGTEGTVEGWSTNYNNFEGSRTLHYIDLPWIDDDKCIEESPGLSRVYLAEDKFCAGYVNQSKGTCLEDIGGGFMVLKNGRYYLRGVVSGSLYSGLNPLSCNATHYTTFTSFAHHSAWVKREIGDQESIDGSGTTDVCGLRTQTTSLVHGGTDTPRGAWPWLAALYENEDNSFVCGESLISNKHVLTAAHCLRNLNETYTKDQITVVLGRYEQSSPYEEYNVPRIVSRLHIHDSYRKIRKSLYDIALLELDAVVVSNDYIQPICLWTSNPTSSGQEESIATVVGWGQTETDIRTSNKPKEVKVGIVSQTTCRKSFPLLSLYTNNYTLCAGFRNGTGPCTGDSGGPLMVSRPLGNNQTQWYLRGIVSTAFKLNTPGITCDLHQYVVYTDVSKFSSWLRERMTRRESIPGPVSVTTYRVYKPKSLK